MRILRKDDAREAIFMGTAIHIVAAARQVHGEARGLGTKAEL